MSSPTVGVVLVHGIGEQREGATLDNFLAGAGRLVDAAATVRRLGPRTAVVTIGGRDVRVYEAWWADCFAPQDVVGSYNVLALHELAWFPWLNLRFGAYRRRPVVRTLLWTVLLGPLAIVAQITPLTVLAAVSALAKRDLKDVLDRTAADVTNYVASAARALPEASPLTSAADEIQRRFADTINEAADDGCDRVVVVAHSLGSVVAYHGLTDHLSAIPGPARTAARGDALARVTALVTIGSPLEKIRWLWPQLVGGPPDGRCGAGRWTWDNVRDRLDIVSGKLRHREHWGPVVDHPVFGRAWLASAHTAYQDNPEFLRIVLDRAGISRVPIRSTPIGRRLRLLAVTIGLTALLVACVLLGIGLTTALAMLAGLVLSAGFAVSTWLDNAQFGDAAPSWSTLFRFALAFMAGIVILLPLAYGRIVAGAQHYAFRFQRWPAYDMTKIDTVPGSALWSRIGRWTARHRRLTFALRTIVGIAAAFATGVFAQRDYGWSTPFDEGQTMLGRIASAVGGTLYGALLVGVLALVLGICAYACYGLLVVWRMYRRWVVATVHQRTASE